MVLWLASFPPHSVRGNMPSNSDEVKTLVSKWPLEQATSPASRIAWQASTRPVRWHMPVKKRQYESDECCSDLPESVVPPQNRYSRHSRAQAGE